MDQMSVLTSGPRPNTAEEQRPSIRAGARKSPRRKFKGRVVLVLRLTGLDASLCSCQVIIRGQVISQMLREITARVHTSKIHWIHMGFQM